jgi:hypothetical protein
VTGGRRKLHNEELHDLYNLPSTIRIIKSWMMRWAEQVEREWGEEDHIQVIGKKPREKETTRKTKI